ncbi:phage tail length tape measure family protein [Hyphomonas sp. UBA4494]|jgi:hypothetical protein|uniref:phage tail length tape measure family protein n=1 Tax=Hyphomonas sp. UBA4494 TaxID=1946631 RepID=UPI0025C3A24A|nr:phage tail length tape measure family protein [Hyphomonas sp. UBA4494]
MVDIARLGLAVESRPVTEGTRELDRFSGAADRAQKSANGFSNATTGAARSARAATGATSGNTGAVSVNTAKVNANTVAVKANAGALQAQAAAANRAAFQQKMLMFQLNDIGVSLASGMNPLMVLVQQGSQIQQVYAGEGGVNRALKETGAMVGRALGRFPLLTGAIAAASIAVAGMTYEINQSSSVTVGFGHTALAVFQVLRDGIFNILRPAIDAIAPWFAAAWSLVIDGTKVVGNAIINSFHAAFVDVVTLWKTFPDIIKAALMGAANAAIAATEFMVNGAIRILNRLSEQVNSLLSNIPGLPEDLRLGSIGEITIGRYNNGAADRVSDSLAQRNSRIAGIMGSDPLGQFFDAVKVRAVKNALDETGEAAKGAAKKAKDPWKGLRKSTDDTIKKLTEARETLGRGFASIMEGLINKTLTWKDALLQVGQTLLKYFNEMNIARGGAGLFGGGFLQGLLGGLLGFAGGGYTGHGGKYEPAGVVHRGEYVFSKAATARIGVGNLDRVHRGAKGYSEGGLVSAFQRIQAPANTNSVTIGDTNIVVQGNMDRDTLPEVRQMLDKHRKQTKTEIMKAIRDQRLRNTGAR